MHCYLCKISALQPAIGSSRLIWRHEHCWYEEWLIPTDSAAIPTAVPSTDAKLRSLKPEAKRPIAEIEPIELLEAVR